MRRRDIILCVVFLMMGILLTSCGGDDIRFEKDAGELDFFPYSLGLSMEYKLDSLIYDESESLIIHSQYRIRELVTDTFRNISGGLQYRIEQSSYDSLRKDWVVYRVVSATIDGKYGIWTEGNLSYRKLYFPPEQGASWGGNDLFHTDIIIHVAGESIRPFKDWPAEYVIVSRNESEEIDGELYQDVVTVLQVDFDAIIERRYSIEKYAKGIGLVFKEMIILDTQCKEWNSDLILCREIPWEIKAERGFITTKTLVR